MIKKTVLAFCISLLFSHCFSQSLSFDTIRFSPDGKYALIYKDNNPYCTLKNYWTLYKPGLNEIKDERIIIYNDTIYRDDTTGNKKNCHLMGKFSGDNLNDTAFFNPGLVYQEPLIEYLNRYNLSAKGIKHNGNLSIKIDTIRSRLVKLRNGSIERPYDSILCPSLKMKISFLLNNKEIYYDSLSIISDSNKEMGSRIKYLCEQLSNSRLLYSSDNHSFFLQSEFLIYNQGGNYVEQSTDGLYNIFYMRTSTDRDINVLGGIPK